MTTRILHVSTNPAAAIMDAFIRDNPHGEVKWSSGTVTTFNVVHLFKRIRTMDDCQRLAGINFNSIVVDGPRPPWVLMHWLMSRCREPMVYPIGSTLKLTPETKPA